MEEIINNRKCDGCDQITTFTKVEGGSYKCVNCNRICFLTFNENEDDLLMILQILFGEPRVN